jgi:hypothetical protein
MNHFGNEVFFAVCISQLEIEDERKNTSELYTCKRLEPVACLGMRFFFAPFIAKMKGYTPLQIEGVVSFLYFFLPNNNSQVHNIGI